jgi:hypothetical protein
MFRAWWTNVLRFPSRRTGKSKCALGMHEPFALTYTRVEGAVKQILCGLDVKTSASVANAECLDWYREWARTH